MVAIVGFHVKCQINLEIVKFVADKDEHLFNVGNNFTAYRCNFSTVLMLFYLLFGVGM